MISHDHRVIFVHIQKTGGSSVSAACGWPSNAPEKHFRADQLRVLYGAETWASYFKFAFVRNPWDRLVSWWSMIDAQRHRFEAGERFIGFQEYVLRSAKTFPDFLRCTEEIHDSDGSKSILRNQIDYLTNEAGTVIVDRIGRFETLSADFDAFVRPRLECPALPHVNASEHADYRSYYSDADAEMVGSRFTRDIEAFGYRFE